MSDDLKRKIDDVDKGKIWVPKQFRFANLYYPF